MPNLGTLFCAILTDLRTALGAFVLRHVRAQAAAQAVIWLGTRAYVPAPAPHPAIAIPAELWTLVQLRLGRAIARFTRLYDRWQTNTLPNPRPSRAGEKRPARRPRPYFPRRRAWLSGATDHHVRCHASQLQYMLSQPDATEFLDAVPRAGRILRPLCHMLGIEPPAPIILPPRPRKPRPKPEKPPREPARHGKYTVAQARHYSPGRIPNRIPRPA